MIRVALVEDHAVVRRGLRALIDSSDDMQVVAEAGSGVEGLAVVAETRPDVALVDVQLPAMDGITATELMLRSDAEPRPRVVVLTAFGDEATVFGALRAGASAFLLKDSPPEVVLGAIRTVMRGEALVGPEVTRMVIERALAAPPAAPAPMPGGSAAAAPMPGGSAAPVPTSGGSAAPAAGCLPGDLTPRELEVLALVGAGLSNAEICERLVISAATTKTHIRHLLAKTGARDRAQLVILAYESGLVTPTARPGREPGPARAGRLPVVGRPHWIDSGRWPGRRR
jgi:DNA-binding NarL/FixJ family response regulator